MWCVKRRVLLGRDGMRVRGEAGERAYRAARSTHLCPGGCVNSPSPVAPFPPGVVVRAAPVLRRTKSVPPLHPLLSPPPLPFFFNPSPTPAKSLSPPQTPKKKRFKQLPSELVMRLLWDHWWCWGGETGETWRGGAEGWREGSGGMLMEESAACGTCAPLPFFPISWAFWMSKRFTCVLLVPPPYSHLQLRPISQ